MLFPFFFFFPLGPESHCQIILHKNTTRAQMEMSKGGEDERKTKKCKLRKKTKHRIILDVHDDGAPQKSLESERARERKKERREKNKEEFNL